MYLAALNHHTSTHPAVTEERSGDILERRTHDDSRKTSRHLVEQSHDSTKPLYSRRRSPSPNVFEDRIPRTLDSEPRLRSAGDIFLPPGRSTRPARLVVILRGLPGSGKSFLARKMKSLEAKHGSNDNMRIMSIDDYFLVEKDVLQGGSVNKRALKEMVYEYDAAMEPTYKTALLKTFTKQIESRKHDIICVDSPNISIADVDLFAHAATSNQYTVFVMEAPESSVTECFGRNIHGRTLEDVENMRDKWQGTTTHFVLLDPSGLEEDIEEIEMELTDMRDAGQHVANDEAVDVANDAASWSQLAPSKWEISDKKEEQLSRLDGLKKNNRLTMKEFLSVTDDYNERQSIGDGKKRVRWADIEERKQVEKAKAIGFVIGQTNWDTLTDTKEECNSALTKTKYF